jgi:hypothetical protein
MSPWYVVLVWNIFILVQNEDSILVVGAGVSVRVSVGVSIFSVFGSGVAVCVSVGVSITVFGSGVGSWLNSCIGKSVGWMMSVVVEAGEGRFLRYSRSGSIQDGMEVVDEFENILLLLGDMWNGDLVIVCGLVSFGGDSIEIKLVVEVTDLIEVDEDVDRLLLLLLDNDEMLLSDSDESFLL